MPTINVLDSAGSTVAIEVPNTNGQQTMVNSRPVVIASNQSAVPVSAASLPLPTGAASDTTLTALSAKLPTALGQTISSAALSVVLASDQSALSVAIADVAASGSITTQNLVPAGVATAGSAVAVTPAGRGGIIIQVTGTYTGALSLQGTVDGTTWVTIGGTPLLNIATGAVSATIASATQGIFQAEISGFNQARVTALAAVTGTAVVTLRATYSTPVVALDAALPAGTNSIGTVILGAGAASVGNLTRQSGFTDSSTVLAASASFTGTGRVTTGANYSKFSASAFSDQAGTLFIDLSTDTGTTYRQVASLAVAANTGVTLSVPVTGAAGTATLYRVRYTNGATLQTAFQLSSAFTAA